MATGTVKRPNNNYKAIYYYSSYLSNHAITKQSTNGVYYSQTEVDVTRDGLVPIGCLITYWSRVSAAISCYISNRDNGHWLGFMSDLSQTPDLTVNVIYREL